MSDVEAARRGSVDAFRLQEDCARRLHGLFPGYLAELRAAREHLDAGGSSGSVRSGPVVAARLTMAQAIDDFENARRSSRVAVVKLGVAEGVSLSDLAGRWGVSRQYIWTLAHTDE